MTSKISAIDVMGVWFNPVLPPIIIPMRSPNMLCTNAPESPPLLNSNSYRSALGVFMLSALGYVPSGLGLVQPSKRYSRMSSCLPSVHSVVRPYLIGLDLGAHETSKTHHCLCPSKVFMVHLSDVAIVFIKRNGLTTVQGKSSS